MKRKHQQGFTLLEALITLVVVSIGLLGLLGLQAVSLANTQVSQARSLATVEAGNIAERMRANPAGVNDNEYAAIDHPSSNGSPPTTDCSQETCTSAQLAAFDAFEWDQRVGQVLPNGQGRVSCADIVPGDGDDCSPNSSHVITIIWTERDRVSDPDVPDKCAALDGVADRCFRTSFLP